MNNDPIPESDEVKYLTYCDQPHQHWHEYIYSPYYRNSPHGSKHFLDIFSITHIFWPMLIMVLVQLVKPNWVWGPILIMIGAAYFEWYENLPEQIIRYQRIEKDSSGDAGYRGDSKINIVGDLLFNLIGVYAGYTLPISYSVFLLIMVFTTVTIVRGIDYWLEYLIFIFGEEFRFLNNKQKNKNGPV